MNESQFSPPQQTGRARPGWARFSVMTAEWRTTAKNKSNSKQKPISAERSQWCWIGRASFIGFLWLTITKALPLARSQLCAARSFFKFAEHSISVPASTRHAAIKNVWSERASSIGIGVVGSTTGRCCKVAQYRTDEIVQLPPCTAYAILNEMWNIIGFFN